MPSATNEITTRAKKLETDINSFLAVKRTEKIAALIKAAKKDAKDKSIQAEFDAKVSTAYFKYSKNAVDQNRTPRAQAELISKGTSKTCASSHMVDMARHLNLFYGGPGKKAGLVWGASKAFGAKEHNIVALNEFTTKWVSLMKSNTLVNAEGKAAWCSWDQPHIELPESKVPRGDPKVAKCLEEYAKITRIEGGKINSGFETGTWKSALAPYLKAAEAVKAKEEAAKKAEELKKLKFTGAISGSQKILQNANKSGSAKGKPFGAIEPDTKEETGKVSTTTKSSGTALVWDSLARSIFEKLGLSESKGFDIKISCGISYTQVTHEHLSQSFITDLVPTCALIFNTPAAFAMKMNVAATSDVQLRASDKAPSGTVVFDILLKTPVDTEKGTITVTLKDGKATASSALK